MGLDVGKQVLRFRARSEPKWKSAMAIASKKWFVCHIAELIKHRIAAWSH